jgi:transcriptional regulator with XRE-family HTH domain
MPLCWFPINGNAVDDTAVSCEAKDKARFIYAAMRVSKIHAIVTLCFIKKIVVKLNVIGPKVRELREQKGWTQDQFAVKLQLAGWDTSQDSVSRLENGERRIPDLELFVLADVLGTKTDDLFPKDVRGKIKALWPHDRIKLARGQLPPKQ